MTKSPKNQPKPTEISIFYGKQIQKLRDAYEREKARYLEVERSARKS